RDEPGRQGVRRLPWRHGRRARPVGVRRRRAGHARGGDREPVRPGSDPPRARGRGRDGARGATAADADARPSRRRARPSLVDERVPRPSRRRGARRDRRLTVSSVSRAPFRFFTRLTLTRLTGWRAADLAEMLEHLRKAPGSVVFHHTHHFLVQHQHLSPEPPNDFAFWVTNVLQEDQLGERLAAIDTIQFPSLHELRDRIIAVIEEYLETRQALRTAPQGEE